MSDNKHRSGFVSIIGRPNVGKSTLINSLMKEKLSIITSKAQTTRHRIRGIINEEDYQIVLSDTPGILDPSYKLQEAMMKFIKETLIDSDFLVIVEEVGNKESFDESMIQKLKALFCLLILSGLLFCQDENTLIRNLTIEGNANVSRNEILFLVRQKPPNFFFRRPKFDPRLLRLDVLTIKNYYYSKGFSYCYFAIGGDRRYACSR